MKYEVQCGLNNLIWFFLSLGVVAVVFIVGSTYIQVGSNATHTAFVVPIWDSNNHNKKVDSCGGWIP
jgi:hypothetical protein